MDPQTYREIALAMMDAAEAESPTAAVVTLAARLEHLDPFALVEVLNALVVALAARTGLPARSAIEALWKSAPAAQ